MPPKKGQGQKRARPKIDPSHAPAVQRFPQSLGGDPMPENVASADYALRNAASGKSSRQEVGALERVPGAGVEGREARVVGGLHSRPLDGQPQFRREQDDAFEQEPAG